MLTSKSTSQFKKDYKQAIKRGKDIALLDNIMIALASEISLDEKHKDHPLIGNYKGFRGCHIEPDWLLIYQQRKDVISFTRTGTHSDLF